MSRLAKYLVAGGLSIAAALPFAQEELPDRIRVNPDGSVEEYFIRGKTVGFDFTGKTFAGTVFYGNRQNNGEIDIFDFEGTYRGTLKGLYGIMLNTGEFLCQKNGQILDENNKTKSRSPSQIANGGSVVDVSPPKIKFNDNSDNGFWAFEKKIKIKVHVNGETQIGESGFSLSSLLSGRYPFHRTTLSPQEAIEKRGASSIYANPGDEIIIEAEDFASNKTVLTKKIR